MPTKKTIKSQLLDFVAANGGAMHRAAIVKYYIEEIRHWHYNPIRNRGNLCSAFQYHIGSGGAYITRPSKNDPRYLEKQTDGLYHLKTGTRAN